MVLFIIYLQVVIIWHTHCNYNIKYWTKENVMTGFMKMFEDLMVAVAFAEAGASDLLYPKQQTISPYTGDQIWDLS